MIPTYIINIFIFLTILFLLFSNKYEYNTSLSQEDLQKIREYRNNQKLKLENNMKNIANTDIEGILNISHTLNNGSVPLAKGIIIPYYQNENSTIPKGWAVCDGQNDTPDLRGRFILGKGHGSGLTNRQKNQKGGSETHKLTIKQMPHHGHHFQTQGHHRHYSFGEAKDLATGWDWGTTPAPNNIGSHGGVDRDNVAWGTSATGNHNHNFHAEGGNESHNNIPPFYVLLYIMKVSDEFNYESQKESQKDLTNNFKNNPSEVNKIFKNANIPYYVEFNRSSNRDSHKKIIYKRIKSNEDLNIHDLFTNNWFSKNNILNNHFKLYDNLSDAKEDKNAWKFCNYDDSGIGFPRDCGKNNGIGGQWVSYNKHKRYFDSVIFHQ